MADFEPIPEEILRQSSVSRSVPKEGGSTDRKSKSSDRHGHKEKKSRSSKTKKRESSPAGQHGGHRSGSNSSKSSEKNNRGEPLISLSSIIDLDMGTEEPTGINNQGSF